MALLVMFNPEAGRSYFHGVDPALLREYGKALELPLLAVPTGGEEYHLSMEAALRRAKEQGAELVCFGDIDIENNRGLGRGTLPERGAGGGIPPVAPRPAGERPGGAGAGVSVSHQDAGPPGAARQLLGRVMDRAMVEEMIACGVDICGENGEFHTIAVDGRCSTGLSPTASGSCWIWGISSVADITVPEKE